VGCEATHLFGLALAPALVASMPKAIDFWTSFDAKAIEPLCCTKLHSLFRKPGGAALVVPSLVPTGAAASRQLARASCFARALASRPPHPNQVFSESPFPKSLSQAGVPGGLGIAQIVKVFQIQLRSLWLYLHQAFLTTFQAKSRSRMYDLFAASKRSFERRIIGRMSNSYRVFSAGLGPHLLTHSEVKSRNSLFDLVSSLLNPPVPLLRSWSRKVKDSRAGRGRGRARFDGRFADWPPRAGGQPDCNGSQMWFKGLLEVVGPTFGYQLVLQRVPGPCPAGQGPGNR
jgi:hypothetical protein